MNPGDVKTFLKMLGIGGTIITILLIIVVVSVLYKNYLDSKLTRLEILQITKELKVTDKGLDKIVDKISGKILNSNY